MKDIQTIIFDFGGVLLNIDYQAPVRGFARYGLTDFDKIYSQYAQNHLFNDLEIGRISPDTFYQAFRENTGCDLSDEQLKKIWNSLILDLPAHRLKMLLSVKSRTRTILLSNSNLIHYDYYTKALSEKYGYDSWTDLFHKVYFSHQIGMRKPYKEIYEWVLKENNLLPNQTLFIEDSAQNLIEPRKLGMQTILLENGEDVSDILKKISLI
jgi:glucose-1-phosphatase